MTVCIAALCEDSTMVVCSADRMWTSDDLQFERGETKLAEMTDNCAALIAGDSSVLSSVFDGVFDTLRRKSPKLTTRQAAQLFSAHWWDVRSASAENAVLKPRLLSAAKFDADRGRMGAELAAKIDAELRAFTLPRIEAVIAGVESAGTPGETYLHARLYVVDNDRRFTGQPGERSEDGQGYAIIGSGADHARAYMALSKHSRHWSLARTLLTVYRAKKRGERAPHVGPTTDMWVLGPWPHGLTQIQPDLLGVLEHAHKTIDDANDRLISDVMGELQSAIKISEIPDPGDEERDKLGGDGAPDAPSV